MGQLRKACPGDLFGLPYIHVGRMSDGISDITSEKSFPLNIDKPMQSSYEDNMCSQVIPIKWVSRTSSWHPTFFLLLFRSELLASYCRPVAEALVRDPLSTHWRPLATHRRPDSEPVATHWRSTADPLANHWRPTGDLLLIR
ncbi:hypothetical protein PoB_001663100 [Plakobranchus ocellatus]|uniref:Uncharacterized protein n=1 Tax=Plakobranchus ocellatus TaxID=259542 RepID=A0AAV3YSP2_9GAST|nr:hypothetical protein PoB_001663100 [Plakobranchus ocellatus]